MRLASHALAVAVPMRAPPVFPVVLCTLATVLHDAPLGHLIAAAFAQHVIVVVRNVPKLACAFVALLAASYRMVSV